MISQAKSGFWFSLVVSAVVVFCSELGLAQATPQPILAKQLPEHWRPVQPLHLWTHLIIHHSATTTGSVESIDRFHKQRLDSNGEPWKGIGYHFVIGNGQGLPDGTIEPTFRWRGQLSGAHAGVKQFNDNGIGICLIGNFEQSQPTLLQQHSLKRLMLALTDTFEIPAENILGHRHIRPTACPGSKLPLKMWVNEWLNN